MNQQHNPGIVWLLFDAVLWVIGLFLRPLKFLLPVRVTEDAGQEVVIYTPLSPSFYLYLVWLPGYILFGAHNAGWISETTLGWTFLAFAGLAFLIIAENLEWRGLLIVVIGSLLLRAWYVSGSLGDLSIPLLQGGTIVWISVTDMVEALYSLKVAFGRDTLLLVVNAAFVYWAVRYLWQIVWNRKELSSNRLRSLRWIFEQEPIAVANNKPDPKITDVLQWLFGFGACDVVIYRDGHVERIDDNCVGFLFVQKKFNRLLGRIATQEVLQTAA